MGNARNIAFWVVLFLLILFLFNMFNGTTTTQTSRNLSYSEFMQRVDEDDAGGVLLGLLEHVAHAACAGGQYVQSNG